MCTVTYIPSSGGFILTHNRDEAPGRSPDSISKIKIAGGDTLLFPRDTKAGGTWIATARSGKTACLLNGAFKKHVRQPPYRRSRGLLLLDFFDWKNTDDFFRDYDLEGIEPFTFLLFQPGQVTELRWDGHTRHLKKLSPNAAHFWCSATLYPPEMQLRREQVFRDWLFLLKNIPPTQQRLLHLHRTGSVGNPENDFVMNRDGRVCTVSITQLVIKNDQAVLKYHNLLEPHRANRKLAFLPSVVNE